MSKTFPQRLRAVAQKGNLRTADLARWFEKPHATVREWVKNGRAPSGGPVDVQHIHNMLDRLELLLIQKRGLPVPRLSPQKRIEHLQDMRHGGGEWR